VLSGNRKLIYVNAFCRINGLAPTSWQKDFLEISDGGTCAWHAIFDVSTKTFLELSINPTI
jgi:hypothetical protein